MSDEKVREFWIILYRWAKWAEGNTYVAHDWDVDQKEVGPTLRVIEYSAFEKMKMQLEKERDSYALAMKIALENGFFAEKEKVKSLIEKALNEKE